MVNILNSVQSNRLAPGTRVKLNSQNLFNLACEIYSGTDISDENKAYLENLLPSNSLFFLASESCYIHPTGFAPFPIETVHEMLRNDTAGIFCRRIPGYELGSDADYFLCAAVLGEDRHKNVICGGIIYAEGWGDVERYEAEFYDLISRIRRFYNEFRNSRAVDSFLKDDSTFRYVIDNSGPSVITRRPSGHVLGRRTLGHWDELICEDFLPRMAEADFESGRPVIFDRHVNNFNLAKFSISDFDFTLLSFQTGCDSGDEMEQYDLIVRNFAHKTRNKLAAIQTAASQLTLKEGQAINSDDVALAGIILTAAEDLDNYLSRLHQYSHCTITADKLLDISNAIKLAAEGFRKSGITVSFQNEAIQSVINGDEAQIMLALEELLANTVEAQNFENQININLTNTGNGLRLSIGTNTDGNNKHFPGSVHNITQPFASNKPNHVGMGLCIARRIIAEHGGVLNIHENNNGGLAVVIEFPSSIIRS